MLFRSEVGSAVMDDRITIRITDDAAGTPAGSHGLETRRWSTAPSGGFHVAEGRRPEAANELALTTDEARRRDLAPGDVITASVDGVPQDYSVVGLVAADTAAHQGFFLKSSKLVVNSTCSLANILVFQRV